MRALVFTIFVFCCFLCKAQGWKVRHSIPNASDNSTKALFEVSPGSYIGAGFVTDTSNGQIRSCITIVGLGSQGELLWTKKYKGHKIEYRNNGFIQRCFYKKNNFLYYAGCVADTVGSQIGAFIKFDMNGDTLWQKIYRDSISVDLIPQIVTSSVDGGFLITGFFQDWINHTQQGLILKTDANGNELWRRKINKLVPNVQDGKGIVQDSASKKIAIVGAQYLGNNEIHDNLLILDSLGNKKYQGRLCTSGVGGMGVDLIQTRDKKIVMAGWQYYLQTVGGNNCMRAFAAKFDIDSPANPIWRIDGFEGLVLYNAFTCVTELKNGDLLLGGLIDTLQGVWNGPNNLPGNNFTRLTVADKDGFVKWSRYYDYSTNNGTTENYQGIHSINTCQDGSWLAAIEGYNYPGLNPFLFVKYDSTGCDSSLAYCATLPSGSTVGVKEFKVEDFTIKTFPNPVSDILSIEVNGTNIKNLELSVLDLQGRELRRLTINEKDEIDLRNLSNGLYLISVRKGKDLIYKEKLIKE